MLILYNPNSLERLSKPRKIEIHPPIFYSNLKYIRPVFYPNPNTFDRYLTRLPEPARLVLRDVSFVVLYVFKWVY